MPSREPRDRHDATIARMAAEGYILKEICDEIGAGPQFVYSRLNKIGAPRLATIGERLHEQVSDLATEGLTLGEISERLDRSYHRIWQVAHEGGIPVKRDTSNMRRAFDHDVAVALLRGGASASDLSRHFGVSHQRISQVAKKAGVSLRRGRPRSEASAAREATA